MIRGLYTGAMGMIVQEKRQSNVSQNLANVETPAFKRQMVIAKAFDKVEIKNRENRAGKNELSAIGEIHLGVKIDDLYSDHSQGLLEESNNPLDFAIEGDGFFTIQLPSGEIAYTRDGSFKINEEGKLATKQGYLVMGRNMYSNNLEDLRVNDENVQVDKEGQITLSNGISYHFNIAHFLENQNLQRVGENIYTSQEQPYRGDDFAIRQGFKEKSNVNPLEEMVKMIEITRSFESNQKVVQSIDETLGKAVNEVGRIG